MHSLLAYNNSSLTTPKIITLVSVHVHVCIVKKTPSLKFN